MARLAGNEPHVDRMVQTGCMWLNSAFRIRVPKTTMGGRLFSFRADFNEILWGLFFAFVVVSVQVILWLVFGKSSPGPTYLIWSPMAWAFYGVAAFLAGRRMAHISPYRLYSGEGATQWASIVVRKRIGRIMSRLGYSDLAYNRVKTSMSDKASHQIRVTWAREWLGIAPAPYAPHVSDPLRTEIHNEIAFRPRGEVYVNNGDILRRFAEYHQVKARHEQIRSWRTADEADRDMSELLEARGSDDF